VSDAPRAALERITPATRRHRLDAIRALDVVRKLPG
jgi:hypothetical protein